MCQPGIAGALTAPASTLSRVARQSSGDERQLLTVPEHGTRATSSPQAASRLKQRERYSSGTTGEGGHGSSVSCRAVVVLARTDAVAGCVSVHRLVPTGGRGTSRLQTRLCSRDGPIGRRRPKSMIGSCSATRSTSGSSAYRSGLLRKDVRQARELDSTYTIDQREVKKNWLGGSQTSTRRRLQVIPPGSVIPPRQSPQNRQYRRMSSGRCQPQHRCRVQVNHGGCRSNE